MAASLSSAVLRKEIKKQLKGADLTKTSAKQVRINLEEKYNVDFVDRKSEISQICREVIDSQSSSSEDEECLQRNNKDDESGNDSERDDSDVKQEEENDSDDDDKVKQEEDEDDDEDDKREESNGNRHSSNSSGGSSIDNSSDEDEASMPNGKSKLRVKPNKRQKRVGGPSRTKAKQVKSKERIDDRGDSSDDKESDSDVSDGELDDEALARRLQEQERPIRKAARHFMPKKSEPTTSRKRNAGGGGSNAGGKKNTGYIKPCRLSPELSLIMGVDELPRHQVVKRMYKIIKERDLQDPINKQYHLCDDELMAVFGKKRIKTFGMMKYLKNHMYHETNEDDR